MSLRMIDRRKWHVSARLLYAILIIAVIVLVIPGQSGILLQNGHANSENATASPQAAPKYSSITSSPDPPSWKSVGPSPIGDGYCSGYCSGRVTAIRIYQPSPSDPMTIYIGGAAGGVWKSVNNGPWIPLLDSAVDPEGIPLPQYTMAVGSIAVDPSGVLYVGTGDRSWACTSSWGSGILKSADGGNTWIQLGEDPTKTNFGRSSITKVLVNPKQPNIIIASNHNGYTESAADPCIPVNSLVPLGVYVSTDGGGTWTRSLSPGTHQFFPGGADLIMDPVNPSRVYAAVDGGVYVSTNNAMPLSWGGPLGQTSPQGQGGLPPPSSVGRVSLAISYNAFSMQSVVYAAMECISCTAQHSRLLSSRDGGVTWSLIPTPSFCDNCSHTLLVAADPFDQNTLYVGGEDLWITNDGGSTWQDIAGYPTTNPKAVGFITHQDMHALAFDPYTQNHVYLGNDGGIWQTMNPTSLTWMDMNAGLGLTQFYSVAAHPSNPDLYFGGTQDNGLIQRVVGPNATSSTWEPIAVINARRGDWGWTAYDRLDPNVMYAVNLGHDLFRSLGGGSFGTWQYVAGTILDYSAPNIAPLAMDPSTPSTLYLGTYRLWKTMNRGDSWSPTAPGLSLPPTVAPDPRYNCLAWWHDCISAIAVAPSDGSYVYVGTRQGKLFVSNDGGNNFGKNNGPSTPGYVTKLAVDPLHPERAFATFSGFDVPHVFATYDAGSTPWVDVTGNLANVPADSVTVDSNGSVIVGTDLGVFISLNDGAVPPDGSPRWSALGQGLPHAPVYDLAFSANGQVVASTYGRGVWVMPFDFFVRNSGPVFLGPNQSGSTLISVTMVSGPVQTVSLSCPLLVGVICDFSQESGTQSFSSTLTISFDSLVGPPNSFRLTVTATADGAVFGMARTTQVQVIVFRSVCFPSFPCTIPVFKFILPSGTTFPLQPLVGTVGSVGSNNFVLLMGESVPYPPGKTMIISRDPSATSVCIIDSPNLQALNQELLNGVLPPCNVTNLQAMISGSTVSEILLNCDPSRGPTQQSFPRNGVQELFPVAPFQRTYTCTPTSYSGRPAFMITGLAYSFVMTVMVTTSVSSFFTDSDLNPLPTDALGNPKVDVILNGDVVRGTDPGEILAWANVTNNGSISQSSLSLNVSLPLDWVVHPRWLPATGAIHVFFQYSNGTMVEVTDPGSITVSTGNPQTVLLTITDMSSTAAGKSLLPGESILISVKLKYGLVGTSQSASSYPRTVSSSVTATAATGAFFNGVAATGSNTASFIEDPKLVGASKTKQS